MLRRSVLTLAWALMVAVAAAASAPNLLTAELALIDEQIDNTNARLKVLKRLKKDMKKAAKGGGASEAVSAELKKELSKVGLR